MSFPRFCVTYKNAIVAMAVIFCVKDKTPDSLIQYTLGAGGVEALLPAEIKISKVRAGGRGENEEEVPWLRIWKSRPDGRRKLT